MPDQEITDRGVIMERGVIIAMIRNNPFNLEHTARLTTWVEDEIIKTRAMLVRTDGRLTDGKIWDNVGQCHTCDEEEDFNVQGVPENKCACPGVRYLDGDICKKCPEDVSALTPEQQTQCGG